MDRADVIALYDKLIATNRLVERKGATMPYTSLNGHMFSMITKDNMLALRLPPDAIEPFLTKYKAKVSQQYGIVQPEYVIVPEALLEQTRELTPYFEASYAFVKSKKPKPTTRKKK